MILLETLGVTFSMFSAIPVKQFEWNSKNMRFSMLAFPFIGIVLSFIEIFVLVAVNRLKMPAIVLGALLLAVNTAVTGGIHIDGFCDTSDALASHKEADEKLEILKDSHIGAFAAIKLGVYLILFWAFASCLQLNSMTVTGIVLAFTLSRAYSGFAVAVFPKAKKSGLLYAFSDAASKKITEIFLGILIAVSVTVSSIFYPVLLFMHIFGIIVFLNYYHVSKKQFGGITGDLAGWFVCRFELVSIITLAVINILGGA